MNRERNDKKQAATKKPGAKKASPKKADGEAAVLANLAAMPDLYPAPWASG